MAVLYHGEVANREHPLEKMYSPELLRCVGLLFVASAYAENALTLQLARIIAHPADMKAVPVFALQGMETKVKLEKIAVMASFAAPQHNAATRRICDKIRAAFQRRNEIAHYMDGGQANDRLHLKLLKMKADGTLAKDKVYTAKQIQEHALIITGRVNQLGTHFNDIGIRRIPEPIE